MPEAPIAMVTDNSVILAEHTNRIARGLNALIAGAGAEPITGDIYWQSGQGAVNIGVMAHANSLPRTYAFPDKSGTVAMTSDILSAVLSTKGDLLGHDGSTQVRVPVGSNGQIPVADSAEAAGWRWGSSSGVNITQLWQFNHAGANQSIGAAWTAVSSASKGAQAFTGADVLFLVQGALTPAVGFPGAAGFLRLEISGVPTYAPNSTGVAIVTPYNAGINDSFFYAFLVTGLASGNHDVTLQAQFTANTGEIPTNGFFSCYMIEF